MYSLFRFTFDYSYGPADILFGEGGGGIDTLNDAVLGL